MSHFTSFFVDVVAVMPSMAFRPVSARLFVFGHISREERSVVLRGFVEEFHRFGVVTDLNLPGVKTGSFEIGILVAGSKAGSRVAESETNDVIVTIGRRNGGNGDQGQNRE
jgi:hypothetical protein